jgi:ABC-2 type transport system ATP-binding protein
VPLKFSLSLGFLTAEYEPGQAPETYGRQPLYEAVTAAQKEIESAVSHGQMRKAAHQLKVLAGLVESPKERTPAIQISRQLLELADLQPTPGESARLGERRSALFEQTLDCANRMSDLALERLQVRFGGRASHATPVRHQFDPPARPPRSVIDAEAVQVSYGAKTILDGVHFHVSPGEVVGVVGANGSGKSTFLRTLAGNLAPEAGRVTYPVLEERYSSRSAILNQVHLVEQIPLPWHGRVERSLRLYAALRGVSKGKNADQVAYAIDMLGLWDYRNYEFGELSAGYRTRFELAKAMIMYPQALLLDEPLGPLDAAGRGWYVRVLQDLANSPVWQMAVVISTQDTSQLQHVADRIVIADNGTVRPLETPDENHGSVFEVLIEETPEALEKAFAGFPAVSIDFDVFPYLIIASVFVSPRDIVQAIIAGGINLTYFRDVSGSSRRLIGGRT